MIETPQLVQTEPVQFARIHVMVPRTEIQTAMGPAINEVFSALAEQGIAPAGPWFAHHHRKPTDTFDFDVCVPVRQDVSPTGRVSQGELPARPAARTTYTGPYEGLAAAWMEFQRWVEDSKRPIAPDGLEVYLVNPGDTPDSTAWCTQLNWFLAEDPSHS